VRSANNLCLEDKARERARERERRLTTSDMLDFTAFAPSAADFALLPAAAAPPRIASTLHHVRCGIEKERVRKKGEKKRICLDT
jgi:hypothetical protein